jgi:lipopolysaccharide/colanic/teichoic acid biosynthesis glycosyltransferase
MKRLLDIVLSLLAVVILLPVSVVIAIAIKLNSRGPVVFRQERAGKNGKPFTFYKLRTMKTEVDPFGPGMSSAVRGVSLKNKSFVAST